MPRPHRTNAPPSEVEGEVQLGFARLDRAWKDMRAANAQVRAEARAFLLDPDAVAFWAAVIDVAPEALTRVVERRLRHGRPPTEEHAHE
jgi:hypothetical protein